MYPTARSSSAILPGSLKTSVSCPPTRASEVIAKVATDMHIPLVDLKAQYASIHFEIDAAIQRVMENTSFILGKEVADFEQAFSRYVGAGDAVGVASGTAA